MSTTHVIGVDPRPALAQRPVRATPDAVSVEAAWAAIGELTSRISQAEKKLTLKVDGDRVLAAIRLTEEDVAITGDRVSIVGSVTVADYIRDQNGTATGVIDPAITQIIGDKIRTGKILSNNVTETTGSILDLDAGTIALGGTSSPKFSVDANGIMTCSEAVISGAITATSGTFIGTVSAGSIITSSVTVDGRTLSDISTDSVGYHGDYTESTLEGVAASITMNSATLFTKLNGLAGVKIGSGGIIGTDAAGATTFAVDASTGSATFAGTLSAASGSFTGSVTAGGTVDVTGWLKASGTTAVGGYYAAIVGTPSDGSKIGVYASATTGSGVRGIATSGVGVTGAATTTGGDGVYAVGSGGANALNASGPVKLQGTSTTRDIVSDSAGTRYLGGSSNYWAGLYANWTIGFGSYLRNTTFYNDDSTRGLISHHASHNLTASKYKLGAVPTAGTAPFLYFNVGGKVCMFIDSTGTNYTA